MTIPDPDAEIARLTFRLAAARQTVTALELELHRAWGRRTEAAARLTAPVPPPPPGPAPTVAPAPTAAPAGRTRTREASTRLVQNALFLLGGLLLAVAAIVFTAVAWAQFGVGGRAALLAAFTGLALGVPLLAVRRGLTATAETFAAVGLLLVLLDGYAAWYVDLFGVAAHSPYGYAGAVAAVTAAVAAAYEHHTGLAGPRFVALAAAQPVLPLLVAPLEPDAAGWSITFSAVVLIDLAVAQLRPRPVTPLVVAAYGLGAVSVLAAVAGALLALGLADRPGPAAVGGAALVTAASLPLAGALRARHRTAATYAAGAVVIAVGGAAARIADLAGGRYAPVLIAAVVAVLAQAVSVLPARVRTGPRAGALILAAIPALPGLDAGLRAAAAPVRHVTVVPGDWRTPAVLALLTVAAAALLPRRIVLPIAGTLMATVLPAAFALPWPSAVAVDLLAAAIAMAAALRPAARPGGGAAPSDGADGSVGRAASSNGPGGSAGRAAPSDGAGGPVGCAAWSAGGAAVLAGHAVVVGLGRADLAAVTFAGLTVLGVGAAAVARRTGAVSIGGAALTVGLLAVPAFAASVADRSAADRAWSVLAAVALLIGVLHAVARAWPGYRTAAATAAMLAAATVPVWAVLAGLPVAVLAGLALLLVALARPAAGPVPAGSAAAPLAVSTLAASVPGLFAVLGLPLAWTARIWSGQPGGVGLDPFGVGRVTAAEVAGIVFLGAAGTLVAGRRAAPALLLAVPMALAAAGAAWPVVPLTSAVLGLAVLMTSGTGGFGAAGTGLRLTAAPLAAAGIAGSLATPAATLAGLGLVVVAGVAVRRTAGWLVAVPAAYGFAFTAGHLAGLPLRTIAFVLLGTAATVLVLCPSIMVRRLSIMVEAVAHAGAGLALLLTIGSPRYAAAVLALWGLAVAVRGLTGGRAYVVAAAACELGGWWLLLQSESVAVLEAYTLPAAAVALLAGTVALRARPRLSSWTTHGPALAAALLPTLASVLTGDGQSARRLLGSGALLVVLAGTYARRQAPVVIGGVVLALVALHELALVWDLVPRWIPLAAAGLLLVGLAMTLERRRRDLARFRSAITRMS